MLTVKTLKNALKHCHDDLIVVMSRDAEGNGFHPLAEVVPGMAYKNGEIGFGAIDAELQKAGYTQEDVLKGGAECVVLWPEHR